MRNIQVLAERLDNLYEDATLTAEILARTYDYPSLVGGDNFTMLDNSYQKLHKALREFLSQVDEFEATVEPIFNKITNNL